MDRQGGRQDKTGSDEKKGKQKRHYGAKHIVSFLMVGDNRIELVPQRTCLEGAKATRKT